jgi:fused signal recognition particle receptor
MFGKLKDKLKGWVKSVSEEESEEILTESENESFDSDVEDLEVSEKVDEILKDKKEAVDSKEKELLKKIKEDKKRLKELEKKEKRKEVDVPVKFNAGMQKFEPDLEEIKEKGEALEEKIKKDKEELVKIEKEGDEIDEILTSNEAASSDVHLPEDKGKDKGILKKIKSSALGKITISEKEYDKYKDDLEMIFLENNVAVEVVDKILEELKDRIVGVEIPKKELDTNVRITLGEVISDILVKPFDVVVKIREKDAGEKPYVILFCGINGAGKTTTIAKFVHMLKDEGVSCVLAAGDTFRAASIEQLKVHGNKLDVPVIAHEYGSDPAAVGFDAIKYAKKNKVDCVLIDTAGRMHTSKNLLAELEKVARVCKPDSKIFLGESIAGNDSAAQVKAFDEAISIDGIILSKADIDEKGGTALSVGYVTGKPILYLGVGQEYSDLKKFDKLKFIEELGL